MPPESQRTDGLMSFCWIYNSVKEVKKFITWINNHLNGLQRKTALYKRKRITKLVYSMRDKMGYVVILGGSFWIY